MLVKFLEIILRNKLFFALRKKVVLAVNFCLLACLLLGEKVWSQVSRDIYVCHFYSFILMAYDAIFVTSLLRCGNTRNNIYLPGTLDYNKKFVAFIAFSKFFKVMLTARFC